ncbi:hypothetical protein LUZ60_001815 [Juncus effusus]|nr:hypothetical protein LUZ60_001815 [Juncus effusus]
MIYNLLTFFQINNSSSFFPHSTQKTPWLVYFADRKREKTHTFYSLEQNEFHLKNTLRQLDHRAVLKYCSSFGWLITQNLYNKEIIFLNPFSVGEIIIPHPPFIPRSKEYERYNITAPPTDRDCLLFITTKDCPFMRVYSFSEKKWHVWEFDIKEEAGLSYVVFNEYIFGFTKRHRLVCVIFDGCKPVVIYLDMKLARHPFCGSESNYSWVASRDELFLVHTLPILWGGNIEGLTISKMNLDDMRWEVVNDIGDRIFFLSFGREGASCSASETGLKRNCVYYISDGYFYEYNVASRGVRMLRPFEHIGHAFWVLPKMDGHIGNDQSLEKSVRKDYEKIGQKCILDKSLVASTRLSRLETKDQMMDEKPLTNLYPDLVRLILHRLSYLDTRCVADVIPSCCVVVAQKIVRNTRIALCRKGDSEWTELWGHEDDNEIFGNIFTTPVFLKDEFHILMDDGRIGLFNPVTLSWRVYGESKTINPKTHRHHLVESNDELFWICATKNGDSLRVCKLDRSSYEWKETESLGGKCFFVGQYSSLSASTLGNEKDMVYFPMFQDGCLVGYSCPQQKLVGRGDFCDVEELTLGSCWIEPRWMQQTAEDLRWF